MLQRCEETNLVQNWEKCYFMVQDGIVLGYKISVRRIEADKAKIDVIEKLPPPGNVKGVRSFLEHVGFYRRFIKDFSNIAKPLSNLLNKDVVLLFDEECLKAFNALKTNLVSNPIITASDRIQEFELMCDASDYVVGAVLGQRKSIIFHAIYCHTLISSGDNCLSTCGFLPVTLSYLTSIATQSIGFRDITERNEQDAQNRGILST